MKTVSGFSKLSKTQKINWLKSHVMSGEQDLIEPESFWHPDKKLQKIIDDFSENTISNYILPFGVAPNFLINDKLYTVPMVIEESSVIAAAAKAAKFWLDKGGIKTEVVSATKIGQIHFSWSGASERLHHFFTENKAVLLDCVESMCANMVRRGGGILDIQLVDKTQDMPDYYQLVLKFNTCDAMGANFINSVLETMAKKFKQLVENAADLAPSDRQLEVIMAILSNYTPECLVQAKVQCSIDQLGAQEAMTAREFVNRFSRAVEIARIDTSRAVTHNKGIFNGIDAVVLATGNDFRAVEACAHAYAARDGQYRGLTSTHVADGMFEFNLQIPLALGTVGGLTQLHPMVRYALALLGKPSACELMQICAAVGLAQNFSAVRSLVTTGIQKGHMKMHLLNILNQLNATESEVLSAKEYFKSHVVSFKAVREFLEREKSKNKVLH